MDRLEQKKILINELADFLSGRNTGLMSILLEQGTREGERWRRLREAAHIIGNPSCGDTIKHLEQLLG